MKEEAGSVKSTGKTNGTRESGLPNPPSFFCREKIERFSLFLNTHILYSEYYVFYVMYHTEHVQKKKC